MNYLSVENLSKAFGERKLFSNISFGISQGQKIALVGINGAGKSTLLKCISRMLGAEGTLKFNGESLHDYPAHEVVGRGICHCPEGRRLFPELTVLKNLMLGAYLRDDADAVARDLERVYGLFPILRDRVGQTVSTLSGGQQQMVAIGRALMGAPKLLLLDEPSVGIAHRLKHEIYDAIRQIRDAGVAILMAEQDALSALRIAERAYVLEHGSVAREGPVAELSKDDHIRQIYLGVA